MQGKSTFEVGSGQVAMVGALFLAILALTVPINHDEGQYLAASRLVAEGWRPIADFPYLQTPLQPFLFAPLQWLDPGDLLTASRLANAALVAGSAALLGRTVTAHTGRRGDGVLAAVLLLACDSVQFAGTVARNDALPLFLLALGLERVWGAARAGHGRFFVAGLALAAAASAKISFAFPAAAVGLAMAWMHGRQKPSLVAALAGGMAVGLAPTALMFAADPTRFRFYVFDYSLDAVRAFQTLNGSTGQLLPVKRGVRFLTFAALGPLLVLLGFAVFAAAKGRRAPQGLGLVVVAAFIAATLPMPMYRQYLVPLTLPLILWLGLSGQLRSWFEWRRPALAGLLVLLVVAGSFRSVRQSILNDPSARPLQVSAEAREIGRLARSAGVTRIVSLDAVRATDSGLTLDRRFAPGPFLFRAGNLPACRDERLCPVTFANLAPLQDDGPVALVTGSESRPVGPLVHGLDGPLIEWARTNGAVPRRVGHSTLWIVSPR